MKKIAVLLLVASFLGSCANSNKSNNTESQSSVDTLKNQEIVDTEHTARTSLDYYGEYEGLLPCADCSGIKVKLTLNKDNTFILDTQYQKDGVPEVEPETGKFSWNKEKANTIVLDDVKENYRQFFVAEGHIIVLDTEGNRIEGALADKYILKQVKTYND